MIFAGNKSAALFVVVCVLALMALASGSVQAQDSSLNLWDLYKQGEFEEVVLQGKALLNTGTETGSILLAVGRSLADMDRHEEATFFLQRAIVSDNQKTWVYAWGQVYLGKCHYHQGEFSAAREALIAARDCGATRNATNEAIRSLNVLGLAESYDHWDNVETEHFSCYFSPRLKNPDRAVFTAELEQAHARLTTWFKGTPKRKIRFFQWVDNDEASQTGIPELSFSLPEDNICHVGLGRAVEHELSHLIISQVVNPVVKSGLISEGTECFFANQEGSWLPLAREARLAQAQEMGLADPVPLSVMSLWLDWESQTEAVARSVAAAFVNILIQKGGQDLFLEALSDQSPAHFQKIYGAELAAWIKVFENDLNR